MTIRTSDDAPFARWFCGECPVNRLASILLLLAALETAAPALGAEIVGKVADSHGTPISNVAVLLVDASGHPVRSVLTNTRGIFLVKGLNPGDYDLRLHPLTGGWLGRILPVHLPPSGLTVRWQIVPRAVPLVRAAGSLAHG